MSKRIAQVEIIVYKIKNNQPLFLLLKRIESRGEFWQPITGGANDDETLEDAAKRELMEETQIKNYLNFINKVHYFEFDIEIHGRIKEYVFAVEVNEKTEVVLSDEHEEKKWCNFEESLKLLKYENNKEGFRKVFKIINK
ncbi:MAG: NUDIX pyrophosphatase [Candidatus Magasanikbacteria bacterium CG_4_10_14_0_8_um_filter_32_14]|uniref:NUDIX pyrophosphatase n=1 Tax=Candidatus Magasanikbacteria bacterium CG_4_10_14_0_8_um_filter_32_14 TaxID=1974640 RepID=A0A2M7R9Q2_9BACT|nr:MAG: NUDIX pyrophosphatase [Candidatus Magasanikbacteria bacterium CG_4_10_14_0_8_um_filter_32_14]